MSRRLAGYCWSEVGRWYVDGTCCLLGPFPKGQPKVQVAGKSPLSSCLVLLLPLLLPLLLTAAPAALTTECPVRASSSPIALFLLLLLLQPHLASPQLCTPCSPRLVQLLDFLQHLVELSLSTPEQTLQSSHRRVRVSGRGHEIVNSRIV